MSHKVFLGFALASCLLSISCFASGSSTTESAQVAELNTSDMMLIEKNKAMLNIDGVDYNFDSYIKLFQQPYYVSVSRVDGKPMTREVATKVATEYIKPRGCTGILERDANLDQSNADNSKWIIGFLC
ncbi:hypothetical protein VH441_08560 [Psychrobacter sp. HD31]|uniref:hypothetical protein n=1 Tax=Psychrobacter sp. HD31 TaxID=3112003 RepID=UPI003DA56F24